MSKPPRSRQLSAEEQALWAQVTKDVKPRSAPSRNRAPAPPGGAPEGKPLHPAPISKAQRPRMARAGCLPLPPERPAPKPAEMVHGKAPGLDRRTATRMRRGKVAIDGRIDLHGMTRDQARQALISYLTIGYGQGRRAILVITGKGTRLDGRIGVIREAVPGWLNTPPLKEIVRAFSFAAPQDGGEGALYVLLRSGDRKAAHHQGNHRKGARS